MSNGKPAVSNSTNKILLAIGAALLGWLIPGAGYALLRDYKRAVVIFIALVGMFTVGIYVGSFAAIDTTNAKAWYYAQILFSPVVEVIARFVAGRGMLVYGKPADIGQLYTSLAGMLNLVCLLKSAAIALHGKDAYKEGE